MTNHLEETRYWGPSNATVIGVNHLNHYNKRALDLGCGSLRHSKYLFNCGFVVDAIDKDEEVVKYADFFDSRPKGLFNLIISDYNTLDLGTEKYDIVVAQNTLSFNSKTLLDNLFSKISKSLKRNGVFVGNLYGVNDFRSVNQSMTFFTSDYAHSTLSTLGNLQYFEESSNGSSVDQVLQTFEFVIIKP